MERIRFMKAKVQWIAISLIMLVGVLAMESLASAAVYQWELSDPSDPTSARQKSATLCPDGAEVTFVTATDYFDLDLSKAYLPSSDLSKTAFDNCSFDDGYLTGANLSSVKIFWTSLVNVDASHTNLDNASLDACNLTGANLVESTWHKASIVDCNFSKAFLKNADFQGAILLHSCEFTNALMCEVQLNKLALIICTMTGTDLSNANLAGTVFMGCDVTNAVFTGSTVLGTSFSATSLTKEQLYSTASYKEKNLSGISFNLVDLTGWDLSGQNLTGAAFFESNLSSVDFTDAIIEQAEFFDRLSASQLYSTASYKNKTLQGIILSADLSGGDFSKQNLQNARISSANLTGADFSQANLNYASFPNANFKIANLSAANMMHAFFEGATFAGANLTGADARGATVLDTTGAIVKNFVEVDGMVHGLDLSGGGKLVVRNYVCEEEEGRLPIAVKVQNVMTMGGSGVLDLVFDENPWNSTISFDAEIEVTLGGILKLEFEDGTDVSSLVGTTYHIFDWTGVGPKGKFTVESDYAWNLDALYSTGEIILVPEPSGFVMGVMGLMGLITIRRKITNRLVSK